MASWNNEGMNRRSVSLVLAIASLAPACGTFVSDVAADEEHRVVLQAALDVCRSGCSDVERIWFYDPLERFSPDDRNDIARPQGVPVRFYAELREPWGEGSAFPEGEFGISYENVRNVARDVVAVDQWTTQGLALGFGTTLLYQWDGLSWSRVDPEDVGITTTTALS